MKRYARWLFTYSFASFLCVLAFGLARRAGPLRELGGPAGKSVALFHTHFADLCWLGSAALGAFVLWASERQGHLEKPVRWLATAYIVGTASFSLSFLARAAGLLADVAALRTPVFVALVAFGSVCFAAVLALGACVLRSLVAEPPSVADTSEPGDGA